MFLANRYISVKQSVKQALLNVRGLGLRRRNLISIKFGVRPSTMLKAVAYRKRRGITRFVERRYITGLKQRTLFKNNLKQQIVYGSYKGIRLRQGLPANGQRTRSNAQNSRKLRLQIKLKTLSKAKIIKRNK